MLVCCTPASGFLAGLQEAAELTKSKPIVAPLVHQHFVDENDGHRTGDVEQPCEHARRCVAAAVVGLLCPHVGWAEADSAAGVLWCRAMHRISARGGTDFTWCCEHASEKHKEQQQQQEEQQDDGKVWRSTSCDLTAQSTHFLKDVAANQQYFYKHTVPASLGKPLSPRYDYSDSDAPLKNSSQQLNDSTCY